MLKISKLLVVCVLPLGATAQVDSLPCVDYEASLLLNSSTGRFAPSLIGALNHGKVTQKNGALLDLGAWHALDKSRRFSWAAGVEVLGGVTSKAHYEHYDNSTATWTVSDVGPAPVWIQQLYGQVKWRGVFLLAGMREHGSALVDNRLSSGDLVESGNARPIPEVRVGFIDYQNIPFTNGWLQLQGEIGYGKFMDKDFNLKQYNHYNTHIATGVWYTYKRWYFRTRPSAPLSVIVGVQSAGIFGGTTEFYYHGVPVRTVKNPGKFEDFAKMFVPAIFDGDGYVPGSSLGSWDFKATYRLPRCGHSISAYFQWPWEDGSSIGRRNQTDGLWGVQFANANPCSILRGVVLEYIDFRDQSGPLHWAPSEYPGTTITPEASGADDYYNNSSFNAYANYGMAIGSPFLLSPVYNLDGFSQFKHNRARGVHLGVDGCISSTLEYRLLASWQQAWGGNRVHQARALHNTSVLAEATWQAGCILPGLQLTCKASFDAGTLRGDNFGMALAVTYKGNILSLKK